MNTYPSPFRPFPTHLPVPSKPSHRIPQWMNLALLILVNHPNRHKFNTMSRRDKRHHHFRLNLKMIRRDHLTGPRVQIHQPKTALRIRQHSPRRLRQPPAHPPIHKPPHKWHLTRVGHPIPNHQQRRCPLRALKTSRNILRRMLPIPVQRQRPFKSTLSQNRPPLLQRRTLPTTHLMSQYFCTCTFRLCCGCIFRPIIHDYNCLQIIPHSRHHTPNILLLIQAWNHRCA